MNKPFCFIVFVICLLVTELSYANDKSKEKVVVSQFSEFIEITEHVPEFTKWADISAYLQENMSLKPQDCLSALSAFQAKLPQLTPEQLSLMNLRWAQVALSVNQLSIASNKLSLVTEAMLHEADKLEYRLLKGKILTLEHELFDAASAYKLAFELSNQQDKLNIANQVSLTLANLYYDLNAQQSAQDWLQKVKFEISEEADLATLIETATKLAKLQDKMALFKQAESTLKKAINYLAMKKLAAIEVSLKFQLAEVYFNWQKNDLAKQTLEQNFVHAQKTRNINQQIQAVIGLMELALAEESPWQANKLLLQANKLEPYVYDVKYKQLFWQTKAKVLAAKGSFRAALEVLAQYEESIDVADMQEQWAELLDDKLLWQLKIGQIDDVQETFKAYQQLSQRVTQLHSGRQIDFLQKSRSSDQELAAITQQQITSQLNQTKLESDARQSRVYTLYVVIVLILGAAAMSLFWLYRKFNYEKDLDRLADPISCAYNHKFLSRQFDYLKYKKHRVALVMFDIDNMVAINKQLGHEYADRLLYLMVQRLKKRLVRNTWLIRTSGDRFVVLANNFDQKQVFILAEILRKELNSSDFKVGKHKVKLRASFAALECLPDEDLEAIKPKLERVVAEVKQLGGNLVKV